MALVQVLSDRRSPSGSARGVRALPGVAHDAGRVRRAGSRARRRDAARRRRAPRRAAARADRRRRASGGHPERGDPALDALREEVDYCVLAPAVRGAPVRRSAVGPGSIQLVRRWPGFLDALFFYGLLPFRVRRLVRRFRPGAVIAESPYIGFFVLLGHGAAAARPSVGRRRDARRLAQRCPPRRLAAARPRSRRWRTGPRAMRSATPTRCARSPRTRPSSPAREAGVPPVESFPAYIDLGAFTGRPPAPLPRTPTLSLRRDARDGRRASTTLADAWRDVAGRVPEARLVVVGRGALRDVVDRLRDDYPGRVEHVERAAAAGRRRAHGRCDVPRAPLALRGPRPGDPRGVRARSRRRRRRRVGGIPDLVENDVNGLLVENGDVAGLADALTRILTEDGLAAPARRGRVQGLADVRVVARRLRDARALAGRQDAGRGAPLMRLVFVTQSVDAEDPILGATVAKLRALAQRCDELVVITDHVGAHDLPRTARSAPSAAGRSSGAVFATCRRSSRSCSGATGRTR